MPTALGLEHRQMQNMKQFSEKKKRKLSPLRKKPLPARDRQTTLEGADVNINSEIFLK